jgi:hypothetical protein
MENFMKRATPEVALDRIIASLEGDLAAAPDVEIAEALAELRLNPAMKHSTVWADVLFRIPDVSTTSQREELGASEGESKRRPAIVHKTLD